jgi:hypothetical protein
VSALKRIEMIMALIDKARLLVPTMVSALCRP